jgi:hypothetical protein
VSATIRFMGKPNTRSVRRTILSVVGGVAAVGLSSTLMAVGALPATPAQASTSNAASSIGFYNPSNASWHLNYDAEPTDESDVAFTAGQAGSGTVPVSGDWDGNGATSVGFYRYSDASWHLMNQLGGAASDITFSFGPVGDTSVQPVVGDWDGDGKDTVGFYVPSNASWHLASSNSQTATSTAFVWGTPANSNVRAVAGDWNADGKDTVGWYLQSNASWHLASANSPSASSLAFTNGPVGDTSVEAIAGDWDGNGGDSVGWYKPSNASFHLTNTNGNTGTSDIAYSFGPTGNSAIVPVSGDWDGKVAPPPPSTGLPTSPTAQQVVNYARSYKGQTVYQVDETTAAPWHGYRGDWCAWFATWAMRNATGGKEYTWVADMRKLGTEVSSPRVGDVVIFGNDQHVGIVSQNVNGIWYVVDGNGLSTGTSGDWTTTKVAERPIWNQAHDFIRINY